VCSHFIISFLYKTSRAAVWKSFEPYFIKPSADYAHREMDARNRVYVARVSVSSNKFTYYFGGKEREGKSLRSENERWETCGYYSYIIFLR
jgi:hypothetical protein